MSDRKRLNGGHRGWGLIRRLFYAKTSRGAADLLSNAKLPVFGSPKRLNGTRGPVGGHDG